MSYQQDSTHALKDWCGTYICKDVNMYINGNASATVKNNVGIVWTWICETIKIYKSNAHLNAEMKEQEDILSVRVLWLTFILNLQYIQTWNEAINSLFPVHSGEPCLFHKNHRNSFLTLKQDIWPKKPQAKGPFTHLFKL